MSDDLINVVQLRAEAERFDREERWFAPWQIGHMAALVDAVQAAHIVCGLAELSQDETPAMGWLRDALARFDFRDAT